LEKTWREACINNPGKWIALENAKIDPESNDPVVGTLVVANEDLNILCDYLNKNKIKGCFIRYCSAEESKNLTH
jgi:hypothetical protein